MDILLECARVAPDPAALRRAADSVAHWRAVLDEAGRHYLKPLLHWRLSRFCPDAVPPEVAAAVLAAAGIAELFEVRVDGVTIDEDHLAGKPAPDAYLAAARALGVDPDQAAVFEDALAGVEAARAGGFGFVVGVDRVGQAEALRAQGADIVVTDLAELLDQQ